MRTTTLFLIGFFLANGAHARIGPHLGGGLSLWPIQSASLNTYLGQVATATGTSGGQLPEISLTPHALVGMHTDLPWGRLQVDVVGLWSSQQPENAATQFALTSWAIELAPKWAFYTIGEWIQIFGGPTLARVALDGSLSVATTHKLQFSSSGWTWGALAGVQAQIFGLVAVTGVLGYRFLGRTAPVKLSQVSGSLFETLTVGEELEVNEIGVQTRRVTFTTAGWYTQLSLGVVL